MNTADVTATYSLRPVKRDGVAALDGHMSGTFSRQRAENIVHSVPRVIAVDNQAIVDAEKAKERPKAAPQHA